MSRKSRSIPSHRSAAAPTGQAIDLALAAYRQGHLDAAEARCERAVAAEPRHFPAWNLLGVIALQTGRPALAVERFDRAIALNAGEAGVHTNRGNALIGLQQYPAALESLERAIALDPRNAEAHNTRGGVLFRLEQYDAALASFERAVALGPGFAQAWNGCGATLLRLGRLEEALECCGKAAELAPARADLHYNLGCVLKDLERYDAAIASFDRALALEPRCAEAHDNRGIALAALGRHTAALASHDAALRLKPALADSHVNRGVTLQLLGRHAEAKAAYEDAVAAAPGNARAHWNLALCSLLTGDFAAGWRHFEWRWKYRGLADDVFAQPRWSGERALQGSTILLWAEQGLGDTLQFCRYAELVARRGARVILRVPRPLVALLRSLSGAARVIAEDEPMPDFDLHCPLMSLPLACGAAVETIQAHVPYLFADAAKRAAWKARLGERTGLRVGLVWSGGFRPDQPETWEVNQRRNIPLEKLAAVDLPGVSLFSLQKGDDAVAQLRELEAAARGPTLTDCTAEFDDFSDTAAFIDNLDLVVSVDTSTAHLAGALGKEVWLLNRFDTCWRWLLDRSDSPWYPGLTLFRQPAPGDWDSVMADVRAALQGRVASR